MCAWIACSVLRGVGWFGSFALVVMVVLWWWYFVLGLVAICGGWLCMVLYLLVIWLIVYRYLLGFWFVCVASAFVGLIVDVAYCWLGFVSVVCSLFG